MNDQELTEKLWWLIREWLNDYRSAKPANDNGTPSEKEPVEVQQ